MLNRVSNWQVGQWLDMIQRGACYGGLLQSDPTEADVASVECYGDGYRRQIITWNRRGRLLLSANSVSWSGLALPTAVAGVGIFTSMTGQTLRATGMLAEKVTLVTATSFTLAPGEIVLAVA